MWVKIMYLDIPDGKIAREYSTAFKAKMGSLPLLSNSSYQARAGQGAVEASVGCKICQSLPPGDKLKKSVF